MNERARRRNPWRVAWLALHQPRVVTATMILVYAMFSAAGALALLHPPTSIEGVLGVALVYVWAGMLTACGLTGLSSAPLGVWFIERFAVMLGGGGLIIYAATIVALQVQSSSGQRFTQTGVVLIASCVGLLRWATIRTADLDPTR